MDFYVNRLKIADKSITKEKLADGVISFMLQVTWAELKDLRDNGKLIPGQKYRITDYQCVIDNYQLGISSANHQFDIIVTALSSNTLSEEARAALHEGDNYFNITINEWKLWYCLDNNDSIYSWASDNGKGVIYRMIDEYENDCPYDFKNVIFSGQYTINRDVLQYYKSCEVHVSSHSHASYRLRRAPMPKNRSYWNTVRNLSDIDDDSRNTLYKGRVYPVDRFLYTFSCSNIQEWSSEDERVIPIGGGNQIADASTMNDESLSMVRLENPASHNKIYPNVDSSGKLYIPCTVFAVFPYLDDSSTEIIGNTIEYSNIQLSNYSDGPTVNVFYRGAKYNTIKSGAYGNYFNDYVEGNVIGNNCMYNSFMGKAYNNILGDNCNFNIFMKDCDNANIHTNSSDNYIENKISGFVCDHDVNLIDLTGSGNFNNIHIKSGVKGTFYINDSSENYETMISNSTDYNYNNSSNSPNNNTMARVYCEADLIKPQLRSVWLHVIHGNEYDNIITSAGTYSCQIDFYPSKAEDIKSVVWSLSDGAPGSISADSNSISYANYTITTVPTTTATVTVTVTVTATSGQTFTDKMSVLVGTNAE